MIIELQRYRYTRWGVDGRLFINGEHVADTVEHPTHYLKAGNYPLSLDNLLLKHGDGPLLNTDGSICVGTTACAGCVIRSRETFTPLYNRIQKALKRGHNVQLVITDSL